MLSHNFTEATPAQPQPQPEKEPSPKSRFILLLKQYLRTYKRQSLYNQLLFALQDNPLAVSGDGKKSLELTCLLELDLQHMVYEN